MIAKAGLERWLQVAKNCTAEALDEVLADDVVFHSPVVHTPQEGRAVTKLYLMAAFNVFPGDSPGASVTANGSSGATSGEAPEKRKGSFAYVRKVVSERDAVLEFKTEMDGIQVNGVDMIRWNDEGKIIEFKVMIRPLKAIQKVHAGMGAMLEAMKS